MKIEGGCHCGNIVYQAEVDPNTVGICHCTDCQTLTGSAYRANISAPLKPLGCSKASPIFTSRPQRAERSAHMRSVPIAVRRSTRQQSTIRRRIAPRWRNQATRRASPKAADLVPLGASLVDGSQWSRKTRPTMMWPQRLLHENAATFGPTAGPRPILMPTRKAV